MVYWPMGLEYNAFISALSTSSVTLSAANILSAPVLAPALTALISAVKLEGARAETSASVLSAAATLEAFSAFISALRVLKGDDKALLKDSPILTAP